MKEVSLVLLVIILMTDKKRGQDQYTRVVYIILKQAKYQQAIEYLSQELQFCPRSRSMSLLAYCYYMSQDFINSARVYQQLCKLYPAVGEYKLYLAQSLYKNRDLDEALKVSQTISEQTLQSQVAQLQALIFYQHEEIQKARSLLKSGTPDDKDYLINEGCLLYKEGKYEQARSKFADAMNYTGYDCQTAYNIAVCHYQQKQWLLSLKYIAEIIEKGVREHPQLGVGSYIPNAQVKSVGNSQTLKESALIEAFNLKAAIEYTIGDHVAASQALIDMPPRSEKELDQVTLLNQALMNIDQSPSDSFRKLSLLLENSCSLPETFSNLLLLYCKYGYEDLAADLLDQNANLRSKIANKEHFEFISAIFLQKTSPDQSLGKLELMINRYSDLLRQLKKNIQDARLAKESCAVKKSLREYDEYLERYISVLMRQAKLYWDISDYSAVEKLLQKSAEFCHDHETWRVSMGHLSMVMERYSQAIRYYEPIISKSRDNMLSLNPVTVANLCLGYLMCNHGESPEAIIKDIETQQRKAAQMAEDDQKKSHCHLCIMNIAIGTFYCCHGSYDFGINRVIRSFQPLPDKLNTQTWFYAKRCILSLLEALSKHTLIVKDSTLSNLIDFLDLVQQHGKSIPAAFKPLEQLRKTNTVSSQARQLRRMCINVCPR